MQIINKNKFIIIISNIKNKIFIFYIALKEYKREIIIYLFFKT